jgi:hypothetical protein
MRIAKLGNSGKPSSGLSGRSPSGGGVERAGGGGGGVVRGAGSGVGRSPSGGGVGRVGGGVDGRTPFGGGVGRSSGTRVSIGDEPRGLTAGGGVTADWPTPARQVP